MAKKTYKINSESHVLKTLSKKQSCDCGIPVNVVGTNDGTTATLSWDPVSGATGYTYGGYYADANMVRSAVVLTAITVPVSKFLITPMEALLECGQSVMVGAII